MAEHQVPRVVYITEAELTSLINNSSATNHVDARFGGGRCWLDDKPENAWAFALLVKWRGLDLSFDY